MGLSHLPNQRAVLSFLIKLLLFLDESCLFGSYLVKDYHKIWGCLNFCGVSSIEISIVAYTLSFQGNYLTAVCVFEFWPSFSEMWYYGYLRFSRPLADLWCDLDLLGELTDVLDSSNPRISVPILVFGKLKIMDSSRISWAWCKLHQNSAHLFYLVLLLLSFWNLAI